ncbi:MAG: hypothetical protein M1816_001855 [Peltula sp. TS41687]|nr:MAG: hypothetical protein M1816_001855 [Peltula sp. TS41687]
MVQPQGPNAALAGPGVMEAEVVDEEGPDGLAPEATEPETSDRNSGITSTKSLVGSVLDYPVEHDRRYCGSGPDSYYMPNDEIEQTRLNILHQVYLLLLHGQLSLAPLESEPQRILDIGTGTGECTYLPTGVARVDSVQESPLTSRVALGAIAMAETYPNADVTGTDLSAIQPDAVPSNVFFEVDDAEEEWTFGQSFDLIHMRNLSASFRSWAEIYDECFRHLSPGGYVEVVDFDHSQTAKPVPDSYVAIFISAIREAAERSGRHWSIAHLRRGVIEAAGFVDVKRTTMEIPIGTRNVDPSQKTIGKLWLICCLEGLEAASLRLLTRELDWKAEDVRDLCQKVRRELTEGREQLTTTVYVLFYLIISHRRILMSPFAIIPGRLVTSASRIVCMN